MRKNSGVILTAAIAGLTFILAFFTISNIRVNRYLLLDTYITAEAARPPGLFSNELVKSLNEKFKIIPRKGDVACSPQEFLRQKKGSDIDFAAYLAGELKAQGREAVVLRYQYEEGQRQGINTVVVFSDIDASKYIYIEGGKLKMTAHGRSFEDMFRLEEKRLGIKITGAAVFWPGTLDLQVKQWKKR